MVFFRDMSRKCQYKKRITYFIYIYIYIIHVYVYVCIYIYIVGRAA